MSNYSYVKISLAIAMVLLLFGGNPAVADPTGDDLLTTIPADAWFVVRVNKLDSTLSQMDQFLAGAAPMPMAASMLVRMQLAKLFGSPQLTGLKTQDDFAMVTVALPGGSPEMSPFARMFTVLLVPVTDYQQFISGNPNCGQPDENGISQITMSPAGTGKALVKNLGRYAVVASSGNYDRFLVTAELLSTAKARPLIRALDKKQIQQGTTEPVWIYVNMTAAAKVAVPAIRAQLQAMKGMMQNVEANAPGSQPKNIQGIMDSYADILEAFMNQTKSITIIVRPQPSVLNINQAISAVPGTEMAKMFTANASAKKENELLGYLENGAVANFACRMDAPFWKKLSEKYTSLFTNLMGETLTAEDTARLKTVATDIIDSLGGPVALSFSANPQDKPPFSFKYVLAVRDADKFNKANDEALEMWNSGGMADFYKNMGLEMNFTVAKAAATYKGVSIDSAKLVVKPPTDSISPQAVMINQIYGDGLEYRWALVGGLDVFAVGTKADADVRELIDKAKTGGPKQMASEITAALSVLPEAKKADFVGTLNYLRLLKMIQTLMPVPIPQIDISSNSNIAFAGKAAFGKMTIDIAFPKQHAIEIAQALIMMQQQMQSSRQPGTEQPMIEAAPPESEHSASVSEPARAPVQIVEAGPKKEELIIEPLVGIGGVRFGMTAEQMKEILGEPASSTGHAYHYLNSGIVIMTTPDNTVDTIFCGDRSNADSPLVKNCKYRTSKRIGMGSTRQEIIGAYGQPSYSRNYPDGSGTVMLEYKQISSSFTIRDGKVVHMLFKAPR